MEATLRGTASWARSSRPEHDPSDFDPQRHEELLRSNPSQYAEMVRNITAYGVYRLDRDGRVQSWNKGAENITGWKENERVGVPFAQLFDDASRREAVPEKTLQFVHANRHVREEHTRLRKNGEPFTAMVTMDVVRASSGELLGFVEVFQDITELKRREQALYNRATKDALTGVLNRGHFTETATQEIERARRFAEPLSVIMIDIDHFKSVNDTYGHEVGDKVIIALAKCCQENIRKIDYVGRIGGEEFVVLLPRANKEPAADMAKRLRLKIMERRVPVGEREILFTASLGVAALRPHTRDLAELLRNADAALYKAKREGRNRVEVWFE